MASGHPALPARSVGLILALALAGKVQAEPGRAPAEALLPGDTSACYAYYPDEVRCLATRGAINGLVEGWLPDSLPAEKAARMALFESLRSNALAGVTEEAFLAGMKRQTPLHGDLDEETRRERSKWEAGWKSKTPDSTLRRLYARYTDALFRLQPEARLEVLAATDSVLIDSLAVALRNRQTPAPWVPASLPLQGLPEDLCKWAMESVPGKWVGPNRARFGFVLLRLVKVGRRAMPSLEESSPVLAVLAGRPGLSADSLEAETRRYYALHPAEFAKPCKAALEIELRPRTFRKMDERLINRWVVEQSDLPDEVGRALGPCPSILPGDTLGPLENAWGRWKVRVKENSLHSQPLPFALAAERIRAQLLRQEEEKALRFAQERVALKWTAKERLLTRNAVEGAVSPPPEQLDSIVRTTDPRSLSAYGPPDDQEGVLAEYREIERRRLSRRAVDSLHADWIRANVRVSDRPESP